ANILLKEPKELSFPGVGKISSESFKAFSGIMEKLGRILDNINIIIRKFRKCFKIYPNMVNKEYKSTSKL
ncbi:MAG: hypothetical protein R3321_13625, partial [Nitrososphaeraceae archaeon]|nr:hypothetical protein [Nitrososphaeraceae archaeon]